MRIASYNKPKLGFKQVAWWAAIILLVFSAIASSYYLTTRNSNSVHAATAMSFDLYATHPYASQAGYDNSSRDYYTGTDLCPASSGRTFCPAGQTITDMEVTSDGHLVAGYGDWASNVDTFGVEAGRVGVVPLDLADGSWGDMFYAGSEAMDLVRKINGNLYIPTTDPSEKAATNNATGNVSGYITNEGGSWHFVSNGPPNSIHVLDVNTLDGTDIWTVGSNFNPSAGAFASRSTDGGATWQEMLRGSGGDFDRFYIAASLNGKLYISGAGAQSTKSFDGTTMADAPDFSCQSSQHSNKIVEFDGKIVCPGKTSGSSGGYIATFDGTTWRQVQYTTNSGPSMGPKDIYSDGTHLYILTHGGSIYRTASLDSDWELLEATAPSDATTMAVYDDYMYLGGSEGKIYKSDIQLSSTDVSCFAFNSTTGTITGYNIANAACSTNVIIPDSIGGVDVTAIGEGAFRNLGITSVVLPDTILTISDRAFNNNQITDLTIPDSVTSIGASAFNNNQITDLTIPSSVTSIGTFAFERNQITDLTIPNSVTSIGGNAFSSNQITDLTIPNSVTSIGTGAFSNNQITDLTIPDSVTSIGQFAFQSNQITDLTIPDSVTSIGGYAFYNNSITSLVIPDSVTTIGFFAFSINSLTSVVIPDSVTTIDTGAFAGSGVNTVYLKGETSLGQNAFAAVPSTLYSSCYSLQCYEDVNKSASAGNIVRVYADHPDHYSDEIYKETARAASFGVDPVVIGGYIINPAQAAISYTSTSGTQLHEAKLSVGPSLQDYSIESFLAAYPDPTTDDLADAYYRQGQSVTFEPLAIAGYTSPSSITSSMDSPSNDVAFAYEQIAGTNNGNTSTGIDGGSILAPNTGVASRVQSWAGVALAAIIGVFLAIIVTRKITTKSKR